MAIKYWITREEEAALPEFKSHKEAKDFFKNRYGSKFILETIEVIEGEKMYFYQLIHDMKAWKKGMKDLEEKGYASGMDFVTAAQPIQIWESGGIHIVH